MQVKTKDAVETSHMMQVDAADKAAAAAAAATIAQARFVASAVVTNFSARTQKADINVVYRIPKGVELDLPDVVGERLKALNVA